MRDAKGAFVKSINATLKETFSILVERKVILVKRRGRREVEADRRVAFSLSLRSGIGRLSLRSFHPRSRRYLPEAQGVQEDDSWSWA